MRKKKPKICVTSAVASDIPEMATIDEACFGAEAMTRRWFSRQLTDDDSLHFAYVAVCSVSKKKIGYILSELQGDEVLLLRVAVLPMYRRQGHGTHLVAMLQVDKPDEVHTFNTMVPEKCLDLQLFLKSQGWKCVGIKEKGFKKRDQDGYKFQFLPGVGAHDERR